jgi:hypothetical protein
MLVLPNLKLHPYVKVQEHFIVITIHITNSDSVRRLKAGERRMTYVECDSHPSFWHLLYISV